MSTKKDFLSVVGKESGKTLLRKLYSEAEKLSDRDCWDLRQEIFEILYNKAGNMNTLEKSLLNMKLAVIRSEVNRRGLHKDTLYDGQGEALQEK